MTEDEARQAMGCSKQPFKSWDDYLAASRKAREAEAMMNAGPAISREERHRDAIAAEYQRILDAANAGMPSQAPDAPLQATDWTSPQFGELR